MVETGLSAEALLAHEPPVRLAVFAGVLAATMLWEQLSPRRARIEPWWRHAARNLSFYAVAAAAVRLLFTMLPVALAAVLYERGWGLFGVIDWPFWLEVAVTVVAFDFVIYLQHVMFHAVPLLWRLHMVHHTDLDLDATSGIRFHPIEIALSLVLKLAAVAAVGPPAFGVLLFEIVLNATAMFNHANLKLPHPLDRVLRWILVTPDMHRVHHSTIVAETNSNFGFNLPWWDRLFGTYRDQPVAGHERMQLGLAEYRDVRRLRLWRLLWLPFTKPPVEYTIRQVDAVTDQGHASAAEE